MEVPQPVKSLLDAKFLGAILGLYILHLVGYTLYHAFIYPYYFSPLRHLPGPTDHHFVLGQIINQIKSDSPNEPFVSWMRRWPHAPLIRYFTFGNSEALLVTNLAAHREILQEKCYSFQKPRWFIRLLIGITGNGLALSEGEKHKKERRVLNGMFSLTKLKTLIPVLQSKARDLSVAFGHAIDRDDGVVELGSMYSKIMLDIMGVFALGIELKNLTKGNTTSFHDCYQDVFNPGTFGQILMAIDGFIPIRWLPVEVNRQYLRATETLHRQLMDIIKSRIREIKEARDGGETIGGGEEQKVKDMLTFMVKEKYFADDGDAWSEQDLLNQILTFMAAGHETTAVTLVWATYALVKFPHVTKRLRDEITGLLRNDPSPDYSSMEKLHYLNNFVREVLRWRCPAIHAPREAAEDVVIQGVKIPKGTSLVIYPSVVHYNPAIWGDDCDEFDPDRWDRLDGDAADPYSLAAFIQGPRMCIGRVMSAIEFKVILIEILSKFDLEAVDPVDEVEFMNPSPVLRPNGGLKVKVKRLA